MTTVARFETYLRYEKSMLESPHCNQCKKENLIRDIGQINFYRCLKCGSRFMVHICNDNIILVPNSKPFKYFRYDTDIYKMKQLYLFVNGFFHIVSYLEDNFYFTSCDIEVPETSIKTSYKTPPPDHICQECIEKHKIELQRELMTTNPYPQEW